MTLVRMAQLQTADDSHADNPPPALLPGYFSHSDNYSAEKYDEGRFLGFLYNGQSSMLFIGR